MAETGTDEKALEERGKVLSAAVEAGLLEPSSGVAIFDLPCGYLDPQGVLHTEAAIHEITGPEEDMLRGSFPVVKKLAELLVMCTTRIGTYTDQKDIRRIIGELLLGDRVQLLLQIRICTFGPIYNVYERCPKCGQIGDPYPVNLSDLKVVSMPQPLSRTRELVLPRSRKKVKVKFMDGLMEEELAREAEKLRKVNPRDPLLEGRTLGLTPRIVELGGKAQGTKPNGKPDLLSLLKEVQALGMADKQYLYDYFDREEGGVETQGEYECCNKVRPAPDEEEEVCGYEFSAPLNFSDSFFSLSSAPLSSS